MERFIKGTEEIFATGKKELLHGWRAPNAEAKAMDNPKIVFVGTRTFTFTLPSTAEVEKENDETTDVPGFEAVCTFRRLNELQATGETAFTHAQAVCVSEVADWHFRGEDSASVLVSHEAVRWILCFPVQGRGRKTRVRNGKYVPQTNKIPPDGDDVFFFLTGSSPNGTPIRAVPDLDNLGFLSPRPGAQLVLVRAKDWDWNDGRNTVSILPVSILPQDVLEMEIVLDSEVRVL
jgi:hypothetical protein